MEMMTRPSTAPSAFVGPAGAPPAHAPATESPLPSLSAAAMTASSHPTFAALPTLASAGPIAHEAAHVVQQRGGAAGPFDGMYSP